MYSTGKYQLCRNKIYYMCALHADGFTLPANACSVYLGNPELDPVFEGMDSHSAMVVLHPARPGLVPVGAAENLPIPTMEFMFNTNHIITNPVLNRTLERFPEVGIVVPHAGAFLENTVINPAGLESVVELSVMFFKNRQVYR